MAKPKTKPNRRPAPRSGRTTMMLTTAQMTGRQARLPKGATAFTLTDKAAQALADKPTRIGPLLQRYSEALAKSHKAGRPVSFRVDVAPNGGAKVTPIEEAAPKPAGFPIEEAHEPNPELETALAVARERGRISAAEILGGEDMLSAEALALRLGTTRMTVNAKRQNKQLLGLDGAKRGFRFPVWQLDAEDKPRLELPELHERLGGPWAVYRFLVQPHGELDGLSGREALARGMSKAVLRAAESIGRGDFR